MKQIMAISFSLSFLVFLLSCGNSANGCGGGRQFYVTDGNNKVIGKLIGYNNAWADSAVISAISDGGILSFRVDTGEMITGLTYYGLMYEPACYYESSDCSGACIVEASNNRGVIAPFIMPPPVSMGMNNTMHVYNGNTIDNVVPNSIWNGQSCQALGASGPRTFGSTSPYTHAEGLTPPFVRPFKLIEG